MIVATAAAISLASLQLSILDLLVFVGALWGALVFPVIASFYWGKVTNKAFTVSVLVALAAFLPVRFSWVPMDGMFGILSDIVAVVGIGVVLGLMTFGFFGLKVAQIVGGLAIVLSAAVRDRLPARLPNAQRIFGGLCRQYRRVLCDVRQSA